MRRVEYMAPTLSRSFSTVKSVVHGFDFSHSAERWQKLGEFACPFAFLSRNDDHVALVQQGIELTNDVLLQHCKLEWLHVALRNVAAALVEPVVVLRKNKDVRAVGDVSDLRTIDERQEILVDLRG